jgi:hypothetical protein
MANVPAGNATLLDYAISISVSGKSLPLQSNGVAN